MEEDENGGRREMIRDITIGQYYPQSSVIHRLDPRVKLLGTVLFVLSVFLYTSISNKISITQKRNTPNDKIYQLVCSFLYF